MKRPAKQVMPELQKIRHFVMNIIYQSEGKKVKLHAVRRLHKAHDLAEGTCAGMIEHGFAIALQGGYLLADVLQPEGKKPMDAASFYNGSGKQWVGSRVE